MPVLPLHKRVFTLLLITVTLGFGWVLWEYSIAIFWGIVLSIVFAPLHRRIQEKLPNRPTQAALATLLLSLLVVILPLVLISISLIKETAAIYERISSGNLSIGNYLQQILNALPDWMTPWLEKLHLGSMTELQEKVTELSVQASKLAATQAVGLGQNTLGFAVGFCIMLYLIFFLLRDGKQLIARIWSATPLAAEHKRELAIKFITVIRATIKGNLAIALAQGALGGLIFWILGIQGAILWSVVMAFLSLLPAVGAGLVWGPVAIYFLATGSVSKGLILATYGVLVISLVDNLLRPMLVGKDTKMPDYVVLISTLGGMAAFGLSGFVLGPAIAALFIAAWELFTSMQEQEEQRLLQLTEQKRIRQEEQKSLETETNAQEEASPSRHSHFATSPPEAMKTRSQDH